MKEEKQDFNNVQQEQFQQSQQIKKIQHPEEQYAVNEVFSIRKQSSNMANDQIFKKLSKSFQRIKKLRADPNGMQVISRQFDYQSNPIRMALKRAHELFNGSTKTNLIVKKKIDKMRSKVDRIKSQIQNQQLSLISEVDINKIYARSNQGPVLLSTAQQKDKPK